MFELPKEKVKATRVNPSKMVIFSKPKVGKTEALAQLPGCLIIDVEDGSNFVDAMKVNVISLAKDNDVIPLTALKMVIDKIKAENKAKGGYVYQFGAIDTVTALEEIVLPMAGALYRATPQGRNWQGTDVTTLPNGTGYWFTRKALTAVLNELGECFETLIICGHTKDKLIEKDGKEMNERGLDLTGKSAAILCSQVDAIGYLYREENKTIINFKPSDSLTCGARSTHLKEQKVTLIEQQEDGSLKVDWTKIFLD